MAKTKRQARTTRTPKKDWKPAFLVVLGQYGNATTAAGKAGIGRRTAYDTREKDAGFRADWDATIDGVVDAADSELYRRGTEGDVTPMFHNGINIGETVKNDTLALITWLNAHAKKRGYGREVKITGDPDAPLQITTIITDRKRPTMADQKALEEGKGK